MVDKNIIFILLQMEFNMLRKIVLLGLFAFMGISTFGLNGTDAVGTATNIAGSMLTDAEKEILAQKAAQIAIEIANKQAKPLGQAVSTLGSSIANYASGFIKNISDHAGGKISFADWTGRLQNGVEAFIGGGLSLARQHKLLTAGLTLAAVGYWALTYQRDSYNNAVKSVDKFQKQSTPIVRCNELLNSLIVGDNQQNETKIAQIRLLIGQLKTTLTVRFGLKSRLSPLIDLIPQDMRITLGHQRAILEKNLSEIENAVDALAGGVTQEAKTRALNAINELVKLG